MAEATAAAMEAGTEANPSRTASICWWSCVPGIWQDLGLGQGWLERTAVWLEAGQKKPPEEV